MGWKSCLLRTRRGSCQRVGERETRVGLCPPGVFIVVFHRIQPLSDFTSCADVVEDAQAFFPQCCLRLEALHALEGKAAIPIETKGRPQEGRSRVKRSRRSFHGRDRKYIGFFLQEPASFSEPPGLLPEGALFFTLLPPAGRYGIPRAPDATSCPLARSSASMDAGQDHGRRGEGLAEEKRNRRGT